MHKADARLHQERIHEEALFKQQVLAQSEAVLGHDRAQAASHRTKLPLLATASDERDSRLYESTEKDQRRAQSINVSCEYL